MSITTTTTAQVTARGNGDSQMESIQSLIASGQTAPAEAALRQLIEADAEHIEALDLLGHLLSNDGRALEGAQLICRAYVLKPADQQPPKMRGIAFYVLGRIGEAAEVYRQWLEREPDNEIAQHLYTACSGANTPDRASDGFVSKTFDEYAATFDSRLTQLGYRVPEQIAERLALIADPARQWTILDAGCGTGLLGPLIRPWARELAGIDLSAGMLQHAQQRGCYDLLEHAELNTFLLNYPNTFDLICFADTLIYFGDLEQVLKNAAFALMSGGCVLFNTESTEQPSATGFTLAPTGRYAHRHDYVERCLVAAGFLEAEFTNIDVRMELGQSTQGEFVLACKA